MWINAYIDILCYVAVPNSSMVNEYHVRADTVYIFKYTYSVERDAEVFLIDY